MLLNDYLKDKFVIAGTGSGSFDPEESEESLLRLEESITVNHEKFGDSLVMVSGGCQGWDHAVAYSADKLGVPFALCLPNKGYGAYYWGGARRMDEFDEMVEHAELVEYTMEEVHQVKGLYLKNLHANKVRNQRMVDLGNAFLVFGQTTSGTKDCVARILKSGKPYKVLG